MKRITDLQMIVLSILITGTLLGSAGMIIFLINKFIVESFGTYDATSLGVGLISFAGAEVFLSLNMIAGSVISNRSQETSKRDIEALNKEIKVLKKAKKKKDE